MSDLREMFADTSRRFFADYVTPDLLKAAEEDADITATWAQVSELGLPGVLLSEDAGGSGGDFLDAGAVIYETGFAAIPAPLAETILVSKLLSDLGWTGEYGPCAIAQESVLVEKGDPSATLHNVSWASQAKWIVACVAQVGGSTEILVWDRADVEIESFTSLAAEPKENLRVELVAAKQRLALPNDNAGNLLRGLGALARCGQMAGALSKVLDLCVLYANDRVQFGKPIGKFQAVQQNLARLACEAAAAGRAADAAFESFDLNGYDNLADVAAAKIRIGEAARIATEVAHAVHGAIGITYEHQLHFFTRRLWTWRAEFGSESWWSERLGEAAFQAGPDGLWPAMVEGSLSLT